MTAPDDRHADYDVTVSGLTAEHPDAQIGRPYTVLVEGTDPQPGTIVAARNLAANPAVESGFERNVNTPAVELTVRVPIPLTPIEQPASTLIAFLDKAERDHADVVLFTPSGRHEGTPRLDRDPTTFHDVVCLDRYPHPRYVQLDYVTAFERADHA